MATYFMNTDNYKLYNKEKDKWVDTKQEATDLGHGKLATKPKNCVRVSDITMK